MASCVDMSFKAWRVKVSICQTDSTASPLETSQPELTSPPPAPSTLKDRTSPPRGRKTATFYPRVKQLLMDKGVPPSGSPNPKVSKPSLGFRVLRTLFDNSPPTYTSAKSEAAAAAAAQAKEQQRLQELQKAQQQAQAHGQTHAQQGQKTGKSRPPTPKNRSGEFARRQSDDNHTNVIDNLADKGGRFTRGLQKGGRGNASHFSSKESNDSRSSFHSFEETQSSVTTDSEYDSSSFYRNSYHEEEVRNMSRSGLRDLEEDYNSHFGSGHVDDSLVPEAHGIAEKELDSAERMEYLKQEIERLRLENLVLRQRGPVNNHHYDSDRGSRASSITEASNAEGAVDEWSLYADYAPPGVTSTSVARFDGQQQPGGYRREEMSRHHPVGRYFPGEHGTRVASRGGAGGHGSSSETMSMVTDGSRASSRHNSGLLVDPEPQSGLTSGQNSGFQSEQEDYPSIMSWDGSRHNSGPMVLDRQELSELTNTNNSRGNSRDNSGMMVDLDELRRGGLGTVSPLSSNSRVNSRHSSGMQVDREGRNLPPGLVSPRISFEGKSMNFDVPAVSTPLSNSTIKTLEERFTSHRFVTRERHLVEPEAWNNHPSKHNGNTYGKYDESTSQANQRSHDHVETPSRTSSPPPPSATQRRNYETYEAPSGTPGLVDYHLTEGAFRSEHTNTSSPPPQPAPPKSRDNNHELDPTNSTMFSYPIPSIITVPRPRYIHNHGQLDTEDLSQFLQHHHNLSMNSSQINSVPRSRSTHSQLSTEDSGIPSSSAASQHQSTLERLMISQQRRQNMSSNPMSVNSSPDQQYSRNSRQHGTMSPHRR